VRGGGDSSRSFFCFSFIPPVFETGKAPQTPQPQKKPHTPGFFFFFFFPPFLLCQCLRAVETLGHLKGRSKLKGWGGAFFFSFSFCTPYGTARRVREIRNEEVVASRNPPFSSLPLPPLKRGQRIQSHFDSKEIVVVFFLLPSFPLSFASVYFGTRAGPGATRCGDRVRWEGHFYSVFLFPPFFTLRLFAAKTFPRPLMVSYWHAGKVESSYPFFPPLFFLSSFFLKPGGAFRRRRGP